MSIKEIDEEISNVCDKLWGLLYDFGDRKVLQTFNGDSRARQYTTQAGVPRQLYSQATISFLELRLCYELRNVPLGMGYCEKFHLTKQSGMIHRLSL